MIFHSSIPPAYIQNISWLNKGRVYHPISLLCYSGVNLFCYVPSGLWLSVLCIGFAWGDWDILGFLFSHGHPIVWPSQPNWNPVYNQWNILTKQGYFLRYFGFWHLYYTVFQYALPIFVSSVTSLNFLTFMLLIFHVYTVFLSLQLWIFVSYVATSASRGVKALI